MVRYEVIFVVRMRVFPTNIVSLSGCDRGMVERVALVRKDTGPSPSTDLLGEQHGRSAIPLFLVLFSMGGVAIGAMPWFMDHRATEAYRTDGFRHDAKYYSQLLLDLKSPDEFSKTTALSKISGDNSAPQIDVVELRMTILSIAEDSNKDKLIREMAVKALGRAGQADDIPRLEAIMEKSRGIEQESGIVKRCATSIDELRNPS